MVFISSHKFFSFLLDVVDAGCWLVVAAPPFVPPFNSNIDSGQTFLSLGSQLTFSQRIRDCSSIFSIFLLLSRYGSLLGMVG